MNENYSLDKFTTQDVLAALEKIKKQYPAVYKHFFLSEIVGPDEFYKSEPTETE